MLSKLGSYRMAILVNDCQGNFVGTWRTLWQGRPFVGTNADIPPGSYRPLKLRESPFNLEAEVMLSYRCGFGEHQWTKEVLLWTNRSGRQ